MHVDAERPSTASTHPLIADRYSLGRRIGQGGMAAVFEATDVVLDRAVAIKTIERAIADEAAVERFAREAQAMAAIDSPHVVGIFDYGLDADRAWIVMPLLPGPDLQTLVAHGGPLDLRSAIDAGRRLAEALAAAHRAGIVHRDVKPANAMIDDDGAVQLLDLGIARLVGSGAELTATGKLVGTPHYVAPELITGGAPTPASDMYAFGGTLYTLLAGRPPFDDDASAHVVLGRHLHADPPRLPAGSAVEGALADLVDALLAKDPTARPTADDVAGLLGGLLERGAASERRGFGTAAPTLLLTTPMRTIDLDAPPRRRRRRLPLLLAAAVVLLGGVVAGVALTAQPTGAVRAAAAPSTHAPARAATPAATASPTPSDTPRPTATATTPTPQRTAASSPPTALGAAALAALARERAQAEQAGRRLQQATASRLAQAQQEIESGRLEAAWRDLVGVERTLSHPKHPGF